jgi:hypothetical protein
MFMRDQDSVQTGHIFADSGQALGNFAAAQAGINQDSRTIRSEKCRVARA